MSVWVHGKVAWSRPAKTSKGRDLTKVQIISNGGGRARIYEIDDMGANHYEHGQDVWIEVAHNAYISKKSGLVGISYTAWGGYQKDDPQGAASVPPAAATTGKFSG